MSQLKSELASKIFKTIENYDAALSNLKNKYIDKAKSQLIDSVEQSQSIDQVFVLDFMIESNQLILIYLNYFKDLPSPLANQALDEILSVLSINDDEGILETIARIRSNIIVNGQNASDKLKEKYNIIHGISILLSGLSFVFLLIIMLTAVHNSHATLIFWMALGLSMPAVNVIVILIHVAACLLMLAIYLVSATIAQVFAQPDRLLYTPGYSLRVFGPEELSLYLFRRSADPKDSALFTRIYEADFTRYPDQSAMISRQLCQQPDKFYIRKKTVAELREKFNAELAQELESEYKLLARA